MAKLVIAAINADFCPAHCKIRMRYFGYSLNLIR